MKNNKTNSSGKTFDDNLNKILFEQYSTDKNVALKNKIAVHNQALVTYIINNQYAMLKIPTDTKQDLIQEGIIGLLYAIDKFDYNLGFKFSTYACVPLSTQILTRNGYKFYNELLEGDETLGFNKETGKSEWTKINNITVYEKAPIVKISNKSNSWSALCTPNHKWIIKNSKTNEYSLIPFNEITINQNTLNDELILEAPENDNSSLYKSIKLSQITSTVLETENDVWCPNTDLATWTARTEDNHSFLTGNTWWIRQKINTFLSTNLTISIPNHIRTDQINLIKELDKDGKSIQDINLDNIEDMKKYNITHKKLKRIKNAMISRKVVSLQTPLYSNVNENFTYEDIILDNDAKNIDIEMDKKIIVNTIKDALKAMSEKRRLILLLRFGVIKDIMPAQSKINER